MAKFDYNELVSTPGNQFYHKWTCKKCGHVEFVPTSPTKGPIMPKVCTICNKDGIYAEEHYLNIGG